MKAEIHIPADEIARLIAEHVADEIGKYPNHADIKPKIHIDYQREETEFDGVIVSVEFGSQGLHGGSR